MKGDLRAVLLLLSGGAVLLAVVVITNQTLQLVSAATSINPDFGQVVLWSLIASYVLVLGTPAYLLLRLPKPLIPPSPGDVEAEREHIRRLSARLGANPHVDALPLQTHEEIESAIRILDTKADEYIKRSATQVFTTTAISQNGSLDVVVVLVAQSKMILEVARVYYQRPTLRDLAYLYSNVAVTALISTELDDVDIAAQIQPLVSTTLGSTIAAVPGFQVISSVLLNSVLNGSANAFLTLRVGAITKQYCRALVAQPHKAIRRSATIEATQLLGSIVGTGTKQVLKSVGQGAKSRITASAAGLTGYVKDTSRAVADKIPRRKEGDAEQSPEQ